MPAPLRVVHKTDPRQDIQDDVGAFISAFQPIGARVLIVMYERGKTKGGEMARTAGGIYVPETASGTLREDKYQGRVGLVMALGPIAFAEDDSHHWGYVIPRIGDWVMVNIGNTSAFDLPNDRRARYVEDVHVEAIVSPDGFDIVW